MSSGPTNLSFSVFHQDFIYLCASFLLGFAQLRFFSKYAPTAPDTRGVRLDEQKFSSFLPQTFETKMLRVSAWGQNCSMNRSVGSSSLSKWWTW